MRAAAPAVRRREGRHPLRPDALSQRELERLTRRFTSELIRSIGPQTDIPAPDMATNEQTMAWMMDTYSMQKGYAVPEVVTGQADLARRLRLFRREATGAGVVMCAERACERLDMPLSDQRCVVQGFGNVGGVAATELHARGATVIAVSDISGGLHAPDGLDIPELHAYVAEHGSLAGYDGRRARDERGAARAAVRRARRRRARGSAHRRQRGPRAREAHRRGRERADDARGRRDPRRARHSRSSPTSSRTPAASPCRTSSGCRISAASSGIATRSASSSPTR